MILSSKGTFNGDRCAVVCLQKDHTEGIKIKVPSTCLTSFIFSLENDFFHKFKTDVDNVALAPYKLERLHCLSSKRHVHIPSNSNVKYIFFSTSGKVSIARNHTLNRYFHFCCFTWEYTYF